MAAITLALAGDTMLGRMVDRAMADRGFASPLRDVAPLFASADLSLVNLECALTRCDREWHDGGYKAFYFRADPRAVEALRVAGVDCVSLANNHAGDFGTEGLLETLRVLDGAGIAHVGAGATLEDARRPARLTCGGARVSIVGFADHPMAWAADADTPGINYTPVSVVPEDFAPVDAAIAEARAGADLVVFAIHWGPNMRARPTPAFREFARAVIDAGADVFWGHSAHVLQGVEPYRSGLILYGTGDLVDDYRADAELRNDLSAIFFVRLSGRTVERLEIAPVQIVDERTVAAAGAERDWVLERVDALSRELGTRLSRRDGRLVLDVAGVAGRAQRRRAS